MRKAISEIIVVVMLLMIAVALVGSAYVFIVQMQSQTTSEVQQSNAESLKKMGSCLQISSFDDATNNLWVKNCGRYPVDNVTVFIDGSLERSVSISAKPNEIKNITTSAAAGTHEIKLVSDYASTTISVAVYGLGTFANPGRSCLDILSNKSSIGDSVYWIKPAGATSPLQVYCDMTSNGGGWTLVLLNSQYASPPKPNWNDVVNGNSITGNINNGLTSFDQFLGVKYWNAIGSTIRVEAGSNPSSISHRATYTFSLNAARNYALSMSNQNIMVGGTQPGMYDYSAANNYQLSTYDADHDAYGGNCATSYSNTAWWYGACWSGSFWGGGDADGYTNNPYWTSSGSDYYSWGAIWVK